MQARRKMFSHRRFGNVSNACEMNRLFSLFRLLGLFDGKLVNNCGFFLSTKTDFDPCLSRCLCLERRKSETENRSILTSSFYRKMNLKNNRVHF